MKHRREVRILARLILDALDKVERRDPSVGVYYRDGKPVKRKPRES